MGIIESIIQAPFKLLIPEEAPNGYGGSNSMFPAAPAKSLKLLGYIRLFVPDIAAARLFFCEALAAGVCKRNANDASALSVQVGASQFIISECASEAQAPCWPGHFYIWVEDIRSTLKACQELSEKLGVDLIEDLRTGVRSSDSIDALSVTDPAQRYTFVINQAPKALGRRMRTRAMPIEHGAMRPVVQTSACCRRRDTSSITTNLLGLLEVVRTVKPGTSDQVVNFYAEFLGAAVDKVEHGLAVHFSLGGALKQQLVFSEDEDIEDANQHGVSELAALCIYLPSKEAFQVAYQKCMDVGIVVNDVPWDKVESACEFHFSRIVDPVSKQSVMEMRHAVRFPDHPDFPSRSVKN